MWDVWFGRDANYFNIKSTPNDSYSSIDLRVTFISKHSLFTIYWSVTSQWKNQLLVYQIYDFGDEHDIIL